MFLNILRHKQKILFMHLAIKAAEVNGIVEITEKNMLKSYGAEMGITPFYSSECEVEVILQEIKELSTQRELRIILFEILGVLISDKDYDIAEKEFTERVRNAFGISKERCDNMWDILNEYSSICQKITDIVL